MTVWIALLRGVNVGGHNKLKMADFRTTLSERGFGDVQTYIQSGNVILKSDATAAEVATEIGSVLKANFEIDVPILVMTLDDLTQAIADNPFDGDLSRIMLWFCFEPLGDFDATGLDALRSADEQAKFTSNLIYLHAPSGIGRSKFAEKIDRMTPTQLTARNLRTAQKLHDMARNS